MDLACSYRDTDAFSHRDTGAWGQFRCPGTLCPASISSLRGALVFCRRPPALSDSGQSQANTLPTLGPLQVALMCMVRQPSSAWKEEELLTTCKKHRSTFPPAEITEYFYSNDNVFLPCQDGNFQEVYLSQEKKYSPSLVLALLRLWPLYSVFNLPNLSTCPDEMTRTKGIFSADYLDLCPFHCSPVPPSPYSLLSQIPLNHPGAAWSFRELQACPCLSAV